MSRSLIPRPWSRTLLLLGLTAVFTGYLTVWLPGPAAGLRFLGAEIGEWIKFLGVRGSRNLFYLPPIMLGAILACLCALQPSTRRQTWALRAVAIGVSLLALPAVEIVLQESPSQWLLRLLLIGLVSALALGSALLARLPSSLLWYLVALLGVLGLSLPTWRYVTLRPFLAEVLGQAVGVGLGVWLNALGFLLLTAVALIHVTPRFRAMGKAID